MNFVVLLCRAIEYTGNIYIFLIFVRIIMSWLPINRSNKLAQIVYGLTEFILAPIRNLIQKSPLGGPGMMLDFSPIIATLLIQLATNTLIQLVLIVAGSISTL